jgi:hypothetical protein
VAAVAARINVGLTGTKDSSFSEEKEAKRLY